MIALGNKPVGPFFRFPALRNPPEMVKYLGERNVGIFSTDWDSFDFKMRKPEQVVKSVMDRLNKHGKGIILMHDFQHATSEAVPEILKQLKAGGFKIVQVVGKTPSSRSRNTTTPCSRRSAAGSKRPARCRASSRRFRATDPLYPTENGRAVRCAAVFHCAAANHKAPARRVNAVKIELAVVT